MELKLGQNIIIDRKFSGMIMGTVNKINPKSFNVSGYIVKRPFVDGISSGSNYYKATFFLPTEDRLLELERIENIRILRTTNFAKIPVELTREIINILNTEKTTS